MNTGSRARRVLLHVGVLVFFVAIAIVVRGQELADWNVINPDEAELMAQARAAMVSPVPFSTWTTGTTGPFWVLFLALLGKLGAPLTLAFAHLLSAVFAGLIGYLVWVVGRRSFGPWPALMIVLLSVLPLILVYPLGGPVDFGAMSTELLPSVLVLAGLVIPATWLRAKPWLFLVVGILDGLAVGSKYQVLPIAVGLFISQILLVGFTFRKSIVPTLVWGCGALIPFVAVAIAMLTSSTSSVQLFEQNLTFLGSYAGSTDLSSKLTGTIGLLEGEPYVFAALGGILWLFVLSSGRIRVARALVVFMGLVAVYAGGKAFGHYLILLVVAFAVAAALPIRESATLLPNRGLRLAAVALFGVIVVAVVGEGVLLRQMLPSTPAELGAALSSQSVTRQASLERACPAGSRALVWGWAPELYIEYSWSNTVPFMNTLAISSDPTSRAAGIAIVRKGLADSDCVVDAVGAPFFGVGPESSLPLVYPEFATSLKDDFRVAKNAVQCSSCTVYVRR